MEKERLIALVEGAKRGDTEAAGGLYEGFRQDIYYFILKNVSNDSQLAEDLTQDTFMEILGTIDKLQEPAAFPGWARQIAYHKCTAYFRKRHELLADENEDGQTVFDTVEEDRTEFIPDEALDKEDLKQTILAMINDLPEEQRSAIMLRYYNEVSVKEIAQMQGVSENTVKSRLNYGRKAVKQAVETYEKKNGIKLHSVAIVPLLLWLFRQQAVSAGVSVTTKTAAVAVGAGAASAGSTAATTAATTGAKVAGKFAAKKIIAGIAAAAVVTGGVTAGILLNQDDPEPQREEQAMVWVGYGEFGRTTFNGDYGTMTLETLTDEEISGRLECERHYETFFTANFEGTGTEQDDGTILYEITMDEPYVVPILGDEIYDHKLIYDKEADTFTFRVYFDVTLYRRDSIQEEVVAEPGKWSGKGIDYWVHGTCGGLCERHWFVYEIDSMTNTQIRGKLTIYLDGEVIHETAFTGRGFRRFKNTMAYEIVCETVRDEDSEIHWLYYEIDEDVLETNMYSGSGYYVTAQREE